MAVNELKNNILIKQNLPRFGHKLQTHDNFLIHSFLFVD